MCTSNRQLHNMDFTILATETQSASTSSVDGAHIFSLFGSGSRMTLPFLTLIIWFLILEHHFIVLVGLI